MCIFSDPVIHVAMTRMFARMQGPRTQYLAYQMTLKAEHPVAMILPLPVAPGAGDAALEFIDLSGYGDLFDRMRKAFVWHSFGMPATRSKPAPLPVVEVGDYEASFVPSLADFDRLDRRFRMPRVVVDATVHATYGFAVFQLRAGRGPSHPMAFRFESALPHALYFPTVHVHDGKLPERADFDHALFAQHPKDRYFRFDKDNYAGFSVEAHKLIDVGRTQGLVEPDLMLQYIPLEGQLPNRDTLLALDYVYEGEGRPDRFFMG